MLRTPAACAALATATVLAACTGSPPDPAKDARAAPTTGCVHVVDEATGREQPECLPIAPDSKRVDLAAPVFSTPLAVDNPLFPAARVRQAVYGGQVDGEPFRTEVTLLPATKTITWRGEPVRVLVSQYTAYSAGRIVETAYDWYAQADDGSVWYFGEDVFNYEDGVVADTEGTWQAGRDGPAAMIMPGRPQAGDVYRPENVPGRVFEQVTVKEAGKTVAGPYGPVDGAILAGELHMDGSREDKVFAPGYGEFSTGTPSSELEQVMLAVPGDATPGPLPARLRALMDARGTAATTAAWQAYRAADRIPALLVRQMDRDLAALAKGDKDAALRVQQNITDLRLRYEPVTTVDRARLALWARQLGTDARADEAGDVAASVAALELVWERVGPTLTAGQRADIAGLLHAARQAADAEDSAAASTVSGRLADAVSGLG
ncbi:hypothetical protein AB0M28_17820 [Streptomyces sp. NPDC051940]|uniref:hypothetical protein n=1 Tax=Streptomyces sp. NPDC051940 TaxID=3155675 RepID=UPI00343B74DF